ncbi:ROK family protein [Methylotenera sp. 1P/1]|jgi:glucokinase|uniref:ROK family protein n=1 Tax=Methylotenera sp. 1P/1 TaxID=1131551 RepID=UPI0003780E2A|nr:ROK family protein [Methylotenera sp. 1P/1]
MANVIGIDVGGTNLRVGVFEGHQLIQETRFQADFSHICHTHSPSQAWEKIISITSAGIRNVLVQFPDVQHIGMGFPGFIDPNTQTVAQSPNFPGLDHVNLAQDLGEVLQKKVIVENDALAAAYGEYCLAGKPDTGLIYIGLGTGLGGGLIHAGRPFAGQHGVAMEVGHIIVEPNGRPCGCGNNGCVEQYASASGVATSYHTLSGQRLSAYEIAQRADDGDGLALEAYRQAAIYLAQMLATVVKVVDVPNIVVGGGMCHAWHLMKTAFDIQLETDLIPVLRGKLSVTPSHTHDIAGMLGAAQLALLHNTHLS